MENTVLLTLAILTLAAIYTACMAVLYSLCIVAGESVPCAEYGACLQSEKLSYYSDSIPAISRKKRPSYMNLPCMVRTTAATVAPTMYEDLAFAHTAVSTAGEYAGIPAYVVESLTQSGIVDCIRLDAVLAQEFAGTTLGAWYRRRNVTTAPRSVPRTFARPNVRAYRASVAAKGGAGTVWAHAC
jgi:hypothetical protein